MSDPFTIRIFVPNGDPEGVRIIDRMNWTGLGIVFPRETWAETRRRDEFSRTGVYILVGYKGEEDDLPTLYIGQGDRVISRIESHLRSKDFWDWGIAFVSANNSLNRAHVTWLEYALIERAQQAKRSYLDNGNSPMEPGLSESEKADTKGFLKEILQILPLVNLRAFEIPKPVATPKATSQENPAPSPKSQKDTIVVPAQKEGFDRVFLGEHCWYAIRIAGGKLTKIKYIAAYQTQPISAITHYAPVDRIEPYGEDGKYRVIFSEPAKPIGPIPYGDLSPGAMQGQRYTSFQKLRTAKQISDLE